MAVKEVEISELSNNLRHLLQNIREGVTRLKYSGRLRIEKQRYIIRPDYSLQYGDLTLFNDFPTREVDENEWEWRDLESFTTELKTSEEYQKLLRIIPGHEGALKNLLWQASHSYAVHGVIDEHRLTEKLQCGTFLGGLGASTSESI